MNENDLQCMSQILRHRLRGIAAGIRGALGLICEEAELQLPTELREYFPLMIRECDALQDVATRISLFFDQPPPAETLTADWVTLRATEGMAARFPTVEVRTRGACEQKVTGWMELALAELLANSCEAAPGTTVHVRYRLEGPLVIWTVADHGPGPDPSRPGDPFAPFYTTRPRHLGLGLPMARRFSELAGGYCRRSPEPMADMAWSVELACPVLQGSDINIKG